MFKESVPRLYQRQGFTTPQSHGHSFESRAPRSRDPNVPALKDTVRKHLQMYSPSVALDANKSVQEMEIAAELEFTLVFVSGNWERRDSSPYLVHDPDSVPGARLHHHSTGRAEVVLLGWGSENTQGRKGRLF